MARERRRLFWVHESREQLQQEFETTAVLLDAASWICFLGEVARSQLLGAVSLVIDALDGTF